MKMKKNNDWSLKSKLITSIGFINIPVILFVLFYLLPTVSSNLYEQKQNNLKQTVDVAYSLLESYSKKVKNSSMELSEAKTRAQEDIAELRYTGDNYFWINNLEPRMVLHPFKPELNGKDLSGVKDPNGKKVFVEMVKACKKTGEGFVNYMWPKPGYDEPVPKLSYLKQFSEWNWIIGTGIYIDSIETQLSNIKSIIGITIFAFILFTTILGIIVGKRISNPIKALKESANRVANGEFNVKVENCSNDEVGELCSSFNIMSEKITQQFKDIDGLAAPMLMIDNEFNIEYMNKTGADLLGKDQNSLIGAKCYDQFKTDQCNTEECACYLAMKNNRIESAQTTAHPNGVELPIMYTGAPRRDKQGNVVGAIEFVMNITQAKEHEKYLSRNVKCMLGEMEKFSKGDLTVNLTPEKTNDEIAQLFNGFNLTVSNIKNILQQVAESVQSTTSAANQISSGAEELAAGAHEQSAQTTEVATAVEQMAATITQTTQHVVRTNEAAKGSGSLANEGQEVIEATINGMRKIEEVVTHSSKIILELGNSSGQIGEIIQVINDIADQTNLLALNAAIEAARAGEQGRGFAVVADEVRKLAERTTNATNEIEGMIRKIQNDSRNAVKAIQQGNEEVSKGMKDATKAGDSMTKIVNSSEDVLEISTQVATASEEQSVAVEQISRSIEGINTVALDSASGIQLVSDAATDLSQLAENLQSLILQFKLNGDNHPNKSKSNSNTYAKVNGTLVKK
jgi:methyl-accepting chemotaxis protein